MPVSQHVCGLPGYEQMLGDVCDACSNVSLADIQQEMMDVLGDELAKNIDRQMMEAASVDPNDFSLYDGEITVTNRSKTMDLYCDWCGSVGHEEDACPDADINDGGDEFTVREFIDRLETFLEGELDEITRGNVFLAENGSGVSINVLIGAPFAFSDDKINQINVIIAPTDRTLLGSEGVSMDDREDRVHDEPGNEPDKREESQDDLKTSSYDSAMGVLDD